jgi:lysophospholipase L1-like esterase
MMLAMLAAAAAASPAGNCIEALCNYRALAPYFEKLERQRSDDPRNRPVHILQIGDSHTAGDAITGAWRDILQARYGSGGRGVLPPGRPYQGYLTRGATTTMSPGWSTRATFGSSSGGTRPIGLSGFSLTSTQDGASMGFAADPGQRFDRFTLCALAERHAGTLTIQVGAATSVQMRLDSPTPRAECRTVDMPQPETKATVTAEGGPVTITSWASFRETGGVVLSNLGVVGSQLVHFARTDDAVVAEELRTYQPDLIVLAFGTNEGFAPIFSPFSYEITLRTQISRLRRLAPNVPILMLGAPDASSRRPEMLRNAPGQTSAPCAEPGAVVSTPVAQPQDQPQTLAAIVADVVAGGDAPKPQPVAASSSDGWSVRVSNPIFPPAGLLAVRTVQRRVARELNVAFWDWEARMGGRCSAVRWVKGNPPLMRGDYVHFNSAGGREIGERLQADLDRAAAVVGQ